jgi:hypothetical protein
MLSQAEMDRKISDMEKRVRQLEDSLRSVLSGLRKSQLGTADHPVDELYLKEKGLSATARVTYDSITPGLRVERVR